MRIIEMKHYVVVELPVDAYSVKIDGSKLSYCVPEADWVGDDMRCVQGEGKYDLQLPPNRTYSHITRILTEEEAAREVGKCLFLGKYEAYIDYVNSNTSTGSALLSFDSLLRSLSIPTDKAVFVHIDNMKK